MANEFKVKHGLIVNGSGSTVLDIQGSQGQLFSITDSLSGSLFSVGDISGIPILEVFSDDTVKIGSYNSEAIIVSGSHATVSGSFSGSFEGDGSGLTGVTATTPTLQQVTDQGATTTNDISVTGSLTLVDGSNYKLYLDSNEIHSQDLDLYVKASQDVVIQPGEATTAHFDASGNVGIAVTSPTARLHVSSSGTPLRLDGSVYNSTLSYLTFDPGGSDATIASQGGANYLQLKGANGLKLQRNSGTNVTIVLGEDAQNIYADGTSDYISIDTANTERLRINSSGNVGIGTTSPQATLHVEGNISASGHLTVQAGDSSTSDYSIASKAGDLVLKAGSDDVVLRTGGSGTEFIYFQDSALDNKVVIDAENGRLGIGTTSPTQKLEVREGFIISSGSGVSDTGFVLDRAGLDTYQLRHMDGGLTVYNSTETRKEMTFDGAGNVGIGTTTPDEKLTVEGNISGSGNLVIEGDITGSSEMLLTGQRIYLNDGNTLIRDVGGYLGFFASGGGAKDIKAKSLTLSNDFGDTAPTYGLYVKGPISGSSTINVASSITGSDVKIDDWGSVSASLASINASGYVDGTGAADKVAFWTDADTLSNDTDLHWNSSNGRLGIGTTNPEDELEVFGNIRVANPNGANPTDAGSLIFDETGGTWGTSMYGFRFNHVGDNNVLKLQSANVTTVRDIITFTRDTARVGIGTDSPTSPLEISGSAFINDGSLKVTQDSVTNYYESTGIHSYGDFFRVRFEGSEAMRITSGSGNVGIGTTSPAAKLEVSGNTVLGGRVDIQQDIRLRGTDTLSNQGVVRFFVDSSDKLFIDTGNDGSNRFVINSSGDVGIGTTSPAAKLDVIHTDASKDTLRLGRSDNSSYWTVNHAGNDFRLYNTDASGADILFGVDAGGGTENNKVGIRTASPSYNLDVSGSGNFTDSLDVTGSISVVGGGGNTLLDLENSNGVVANINSSAGDSFFRFQDAGVTKWFIGRDNTNQNFTFSSGSGLGDGDLLTLTTSGEVGVNTSSPAGVFEVQTVDSNRYIRFKAPNGEERFELYTGGTGNPADLYMYDQDGTTKSIALRGGTSNSHLIGGNFGIGTSAPSEKLHVDGNVTASAFYGDGTNLTNVQRVPKVEYLSLTASIASNDVETLPNSLSYTTSSDGYEYLEVFLDGIRLNRTFEYSEVNTTQVRYLLNIPSGSMITYKSLTLV